MYGFNMGPTSFVSQSNFSIVHHTFFQVTAWSDPEASLLLERVNEYQPEVGPMKKFKNKKAMWEKISGDILAELGSLKTAAQCENRLPS